MASNKNQHYVPKFYLRKFSANGRGVPIYIAKAKRYVASASVADICSRGYFYGRLDFVDWRLRELEGVAGRALKDFSGFFENRLIHLEDWEKFLCFLVTQCTRLPSSSNDRERFDEVLLSLAHGGEPPAAFGPEPDDLDPPAPAHSVLESLSYYALIYDLVPVLLEAPENCALITSDHPVVMTNFATLWNYVKDSAILNAAGLVIYYPLSPRLGLLLADKNVYRVSESQLDCLTLNERDSEILNCLQAQNFESILIDVKDADAAAKLLDRSCSVRKRGQEFIYRIINGKPFVEHIDALPRPLGMLSCLQILEGRRFLRSPSSDFDKRLNPLEQAATNYISAVEFGQAELFKYHEFVASGRAPPD